MDKIIGLFENPDKSRAKCSKRSYRSQKRGRVFIWCMFSLSCLLSFHFSCSSFPNISFKRKIRIGQSMEDYWNTSKARFDQSESRSVTFQFRWWFNRVVIGNAESIFLPSKLKFFDEIISENHKVI